MDTINWTRPKLNEFKRVVAIAKKAMGRDAIVEFDGHDFVVAYAEYLIQYLDERLS